MTLRVFPGLAEGPITGTFKRNHRRVILSSHERVPNNAWFVARKGQRRSCRHEVVNGQIRCRNLMRHRHPVL